MVYLVQTIPKNLEADICPMSCFRQNVTLVRSFDEKLGNIFVSSLNRTVSINQEFSYNVLICPV